jgi:hypothetical protein
VTRRSERLERNEASASAAGRLECLAGHSVWLCGRGRHEDDVDRYPCRCRQGRRQQKLTSSRRRHPRVASRTARTGVLSSLPFSRSRSSWHAPWPGPIGRRPVLVPRLSGRDSVREAELEDSRSAAPHNLPQEKTSTR